MGDDKIQDAAAGDGAVQGGTIQLDRFLKLSGRVRSGGEAKHRIQAGEVSVNGVVETRRSHKLVRGDRVSLDGVTTQVDF